MLNLGSKAADLSALGHSFRQDGRVWRAAAEARRSRESSKSNVNAGKSGRRAAVFHLKRMDTVHTERLELWKHKTRRSERCEARKENMRGVPAGIWWKVMGRRSSMSTSTNTRGIHDLRGSLLLSGTEMSSPATDQKKRGGNANH